MIYERTALMIALALAAGACDIADGDTDTTDTDGSASSDPSAGSESESESSPASGASDTAESASASGADSSSGGEPPDATERCDAACEALVAADCSNGLTMEGCLVTCQALTSADACDESANAYFDCTDTAEILCDGSGAAYAQGCGVQYLIAIGCAVTEDPNPDIVEPCTDHCTIVAESGCGLANTFDDCMVDCQWLGATGTGCDDEWAGYLACTTQAQWGCLLGFPVPEMCGEPYVDYYACINDAASG